MTWSWLDYLLLLSNCIYWLYVFILCPCSKSCVPVWHQDCNECTQRISSSDQAGRALHYFMNRVCFVWLRSESSTALLMYRVCFETRVVAVGAEHCITYVQGVLCDAWDCFTCVIHYTCKFLFFVFLIWSFEMTFHIWYTSVVYYSYLQDKIYSAGIFCHFPNGNVHVYANKAFFVKLQFYC